MDSRGKGYCSGCKQMLPQPPGLESDTWLVVAHVVRESDHHFGVPCRPQRTYSREEQARNFAEMDLDL